MHIAHRATQRGTSAWRYGLGTALLRLDAHSHQPHECLVGCQFRVKTPAFQWSSWEALWPRSSLSRTKPLASLLALPDATGRQMTLDVEHALQAGNSLHIALFCKYWVCNATGLRMLYAHPIGNGVEMCAGQMVVTTEETYVLL